jgi:hypothetical protein
MQAQKELLARDLGRELAQRRVRDLILGKMPRPLRHVRGEPAFDIGYAVAGERRDHEGRRKCQALVGALGDGEQGGFLHQVDLVDDENLGPADLGEASEDRLRLFVEPAPGIEQHANDVGIVRPRPGVGDHGAVQPALGRENAGRVDEDELGAPRDGDAAQQRARRLHLVRHDRYLAADERVDQRRFADVGRADQRNESAPRVVRRCRSFGRRMSRARRAIFATRRGALAAFRFSHRGGPP